MFLYDYLLEYNRYMNLVGIAAIIVIATAFSKKRMHIKWRLIGSALLMQFVLGFLVLKTTTGQAIVSTISDGIAKIYLFAGKGACFVFGNLCNADSSWGAIFAIKVLPIIIFFGAVTALLAHWRIIHYAVKGLSYVIRPILGTSGAETLCAIANSFLGQTEAPLLIRNYLKDLTKSELMVVMVGGMAHISGSILIVFASMGVSANHLLAASVMSIPGAIMIAKLLLPETDESTTAHGNVTIQVEESGNAFGAIAKGTSDGLNLAVNVAAMLISFIAFLAMINYLLAYINPELTLETIFAKIFMPFGYLLGFTGKEAAAASELVGIKVAVNEFIAYQKMVTMNLSPRVMTLVTYALCGFSNFSCIGIQIGGIGALVPGKRQWITEFGLYAVLGGTLANLLSAMIAGLLL